MTFSPFRTLTSRTVILPQDNIDTDQIIPARFLTTTTRKGLGKYAFYDWRYDGAGNVLADSPLDHHEAKDYAILIGGANFGCGSSREHAPWALMDFGFRVILSSDIADIFKSNALKNGLLAVEVAHDIHAALIANPDMEISIDLDAQHISIPDQEPIRFDIEPFARYCLLGGIDPMGYLRKQLPAIEAFEQHH